MLMLHMNLSCRYGKVMDPKLMRGRPSTYVFGTPPASVVEKIIEPVLKAIPLPLGDGCTVWHRPASFDGKSAVLLSVEIPGEPAVPAVLSELCAVCISMIHPMREGITRLMCVLPCVPSTAV